MSYHPSCFRCVVCSKELQGQAFAADSSSRVYCISDYHRVQAPRCAACHLAIVPTEVSLCLRKCHNCIFLFHKINPSNCFLCLILSGGHRVHSSGFIKQIFPHRMLRWRGQPHLNNLRFAPR
uniref:LIM zinc-binding domain-containing protein n=1 Tax=Oryzias latipes TaxID=8090 RepID=A0A3P9M0B3_ORYLA